VDRKTQRLLVKEKSSYKLIFRTLESHVVPVKVAGIATSNELRCCGWR
jgi:hypothetical protein